MTQMLTTSAKPLFEFPAFFANETQKHSKDIPKSVLYVNILVITHEIYLLDVFAGTFGIC
jgi:hypothetical protein